MKVYIHEISYCLIINLHIFCTIVVVKGERPLKYETTRPVSAKAASSQKPSLTKTKPPRAKSAKVISTTSMHSKPAYQDTPSLLDDSGSSEGERSYGVTFVTEEQDSVEAFTHDMRRMQNMEHNFQRTARLLQQRLGIPGEGTI